METNLCKNCKNCDQAFPLSDDDLNFYQRIKVPPPTHCPTCRRQRRLALRNERCLYNRTCDLCKEKIISVFPQETDYTVYCNKCWWGDSWNIMEYGRDFDFQKAFFEQFSEMEKAIPHIALFQEGDNQNCKYINYGLGNKSCYLALCAYCEDVYYTHGGIKSKSCMDCTKIVACELCHECVDCENCYNLFFSRDCKNCSDSYFLEDCIGCSNCFCSTGLRNQKFVFKNEQLNENDYKNRLADLELTNTLIEDHKEALKRVSSKMPKKYMHGLANENVTGDYIDNCRNLKDCFDCLDNVENAAYSDFCGINSHDFYDCIYFGVGSTLCYEVNGAVNFNNCKFLYYGRNNQDCEYCQCCYNGHHLFGCFGLNHKNYCILNKPYSKDEYEVLYPRIIEHMKKTASPRGRRAGERGSGFASPGDAGLINQEYGEFFPISISPMPYNETVAYEYYPIKKEEALARGYKWRDAKIKKHQQDALICKECKNDYKTISQEEDFYKKFTLPVPESCPECRHKKRFKQRNPRKLWNSNCDKCGAAIQTSYGDPKRDTPLHYVSIYCEKCYLEIKN